MRPRNEYLLSGLEREIELYMGREYEDTDPTLAPLTISAKVDFINQERLIGKPDKNDPVEILSVFNKHHIWGLLFDMVITEISSKANYDMKQYYRLKINSTGTRIEGQSFPPHVTGYLVLDIQDTDKSKPAILDIKKYLSSSKLSEQLLYNDRYILEQSESDKLKIRFLKLLEADHIEALAQEEFEFNEDEFVLGTTRARDDISYEYGDNDEFEDEFEREYELDDLENEDVTDAFAHRLHELSMRSFESEFELDMELESALGTMENEFMVKRLRRKKKRGKRKGLFKKIISTGAKIAGKVVGKTPIGSLIKAGTSLVRGNVKGALGNLAKAAVGTALGPVAGTVATTAIDALGGGEEGEVRRRRRKSRAIRRVARIARDTYREVADTLPEDFDHPLTANEVARKAVRKAMIKHGAKPPARAAAASQPKRIVNLRPGEKVVIVG